MLKVLVTGAKGFIGSHLVNHLKHVGCWVRSVDIKKESFLQTSEDEFYQLDLRRYENCRKAVDGVDRVFHLAANMGGIGFITKVGADVMHDNVLMNANMAEACMQNGVDRLLFSSSACAYPTFRQTNPHVKPLREEDVWPADPDNFYGVEKLFTEKILEAYNRDHDLHVRVSRQHNIYGPHGTYDGGREKAPAALCRKVALAKDGESITVWGDGSQTRSFLYIEDAVEALMLLMDSNFSKPLNVGSDVLVTVDELAHMIIDISGKTLRIQHDLTKPAGVAGRNADLRRIKDVLGWQPKVTLKEGLTCTYEWINAMVKH
jgi:GDP-D-mannose 3',5'-epimerase